MLVMWECKWFGPGEARRPYFARVAVVLMC